MKKYDIILVCLFVRENLYYLNIIKYLSSKYRIGILLSEDKNFYNNPENINLKKLQDTEEIFRNLCVKHGADKVYVNEQLQCDLCLMPLPTFGGYSEDYLSKFQNNISWNKLIGIFGFGRSTKGLELLKQLNADKYFAFFKDILEQNSKKDETLDQLTGLNIIEAGFPYKKHPVFNELDGNIDYIIAFPSLIRLKSEQCKKRYEAFKVMLTLLDKIPKNKNIFIKHHNVKDTYRFYYTKVKGPVFVRKFGIIISALLAKIIPFQRWQNRFYSFASKILHSIIVESFPSLEKLTEYHNLGIEIFMPHVKEGIITGLSSTVVHSLFNEIPTYNCDPQKVTDDLAPIYKIIELPCNIKRLNFDKKWYERIPDNVRQADMIGLIESELNL